MKDIQKIKKEINKMIKEYHQRDGIYPWDINNGLCADFAEELTSKVEVSDGEFFPVDFLGITNTGNDKWTDFYEPFKNISDLSPTRNISEKDFKHILRTFADETHMWAVYHNDNICLHFDAETPDGVDNPFKLKTFDKFMKAYQMGIKMNKDGTPSAELLKYLKKHKDDSISKSKLKLQEPKSIKKIKYKK